MRYIRRDEKPLMRRIWYMAEDASRLVCGLVAMIHLGNSRSVRHRDHKAEASVYITCAQSVHTSHNSLPPTTTTTTTSPRLWQSRTRPSQLIITTQRNMVLPTPQATVLFPRFDTQHPLHQGDPDDALWMDLGANRLVYNRDDGRAFGTGVSKQLSFASSLPA